MAVNLKETAPLKGEKVSDMKMTGIVWLLSLTSFAHTLFINAYSTNIGIYLADNITSDTGTTGIVTAVNSAFA